MASGIKIDVTRELVDEATQRDSRRCMVAEAIKEAQPHFRRVMVDLQTIRWTNPRTKKRYICLTPEAVGIALVAFDQGEPIEPFSANLKPVQVTPVHVREPKPGREAEARRRRGGETGYRTRLARGRKKLRADGTVEGGKPLITGHLSNVQISRQDVRVYGRRLLRA